MIERLWKWLKDYKVEVLIVAISAVVIVVALLCGTAEAHKCGEYEYVVHLDTLGRVYCDNYFIDMAGVLHIDGFYVRAEGQWYDGTLTAKAFVIRDNH